MATFNTTGVVNQSITRIGRNEPFDLQVARGQITGHDHLDLFGYSTAVGSTAFGPLWEGLTGAGGNYPFPASAATLTVVSSSASDTSAVTITIYGLDANFAPLVETVALNGTTNVTTTGSFLRVNSAVTATGNAVGNISISSGATLIAKINAGIGNTQMGIYTVPAGYTLYIIYYQADGNTAATSQAYMNTRQRLTANPGGVVTVLGQTTYVQNLQIPYGIPFEINEKSDFEIQFKGSGGAGGSANVYMGGYLIKNEGAL